MFPNQTDKVCPLCKDSIFTDAELVEFGEFPDIPCHVVCMDSMGTDKAYGLVEAAFNSIKENDQDGTH